MKSYSPEQMTDAVISPTDQLDWEALSDALLHVCMLINADRCQVEFNLPGLKKSLYAYVDVDEKKYCTRLKLQVNAASAAADNTATSGVM